MKSLMKKKIRNKFPIFLNQLSLFFIFIMKRKKESCSVRKMHELDLSISFNIMIFNI